MDINDEAEEKQLKRGNRILLVSRSLVFVVLALATTGLAVFIARFISSSEQDDFEVHFNTYASEIISASQDNVKKVFGDLEALSVAITAYALHENSTWPLVTIPYFEERASTVRKTSEALIVGFLPSVSENTRKLWEVYATSSQSWLEEALITSAERNATDATWIEPIQYQIYVQEDKEGRQRYLESGCPVNDERFLSETIDVPQPYGEGPYSPVWQISPPPPANNTAIINYNLLDKPVFKKAVAFVNFTRKATFLDVCEQSLWFGEDMPGSGEDLQTVVVQPVFKDFSLNATIVGHIVAVIPWKTFFEDILPPGDEEIQVIMSNSCNEAFSYKLQGAEAYLQQGETKIDEEDIKHDEHYNDLVVSSIFADFANSEGLFQAGLGEHCVYTITVYPTESMESIYVSSDAVLYTAMVVGIFVLTSAVFLLYDILLQRHQQKLKVEKLTARKHAQLVSSLFPENVRDRVLHQATENQQGTNKNAENDKANNGSSQKLTYDSVHVFGSKPIAELYPKCTVLFADIVGFTAWSSMREATQVFTLLESVYHEFDELAKIHGVFKVETIGDCYVAVAGLPKYNEQHALIMAQFACNCLNRFKDAVSGLEVVLGPDTGELAIRIGLHSGPVTAGVLRGERARFQLFGDTVNTASRIESSGKAQHIHISEQTAKELQKLGHAKMVSPREDKVVAKGKGELSTYWLQTSFDNVPVSTSLTSRKSFIQTEILSESEHMSTIGKSSKQSRLVQWNAELLLHLLTRVVAHRSKNLVQIDAPATVYASFISMCNVRVVDEVAEVICITDNGTKSATASVAATVSYEVKSQLYSFVALIASMYNTNAFHNFEHATHVTLSVNKLLSCIGASESFFDITSDPLTKFACIFSAIIHDVGHRGISNINLMKEDVDMSNKYQGKSIAEQHSVDLAWTALSKPEFDDLRKCLFVNLSELRRFRQLVVNSVIATDIFDKDQCVLRKNRWAKVFDVTSTELTQTDINRKATIVIEHLIQASDVAHTMQHFFVYQKWNSLLFMEMYDAYLDKRSDQDPSEGWYRGELWFFDNYVIPLAKKLQDCGAFGVCGHEYYNYAVENRKEWESKGELIVKMMVSNATSKLERVAI